MNSDFSTNFAAGKTQLVWKAMPGDLETPVSAYLKLCGEDPYCFLLESVEGGATLGRYSIIGLAPDFLWSCDVRKNSVSTRQGTGPWTAETDAALTSLRKAIASCHIDITPEGLPPMAVSGLFGMMGYDMVRLAENIPDNKPDDLGIPDSVLMRPGILCIFDNVKNIITLVTPVYEHAQNSGKTAGDTEAEATARLEAAFKKLQTPIDFTAHNKKSSLPLPLAVQPNTTKDEYCGMVERAIDYIRAGDIFQVVPSLRFAMDFDLSSFTLYRSLRRMNPSPFLFHLKFEDFALVGASPEILVRVRDDMVTIRPIAGTRKRGANKTEDLANAEDLLNDPKERSEHLMLLDLGRNDVGRTAEIGSVEVTEQFIIEYYSHVMHIVSNVTGKLRGDLDIVDALFAGFPAGTVSGAPKVRAMEIIDELEHARRGFYAGCAGYISGNGVLDTCIALRTGLVKDGKLYLQAGAGVVADSVPESEYNECVNKARALVAAAEEAIKSSQN
ncbi:MAG: anthranilate synthase component I [Alphaproteobacteria bacterium]|nr:anthranilate synthase component I [Alphaproteobacteria bacterium]MCD8570071.1 anthranilate synthase component I [Alphaproteobacteria bacterium]